MSMKQEEIAYEIRHRYGQAIPMPPLGWHFEYNGQVYFYVTGKDSSMIRFCIPFVTGLASTDRRVLQEAVLETNRNVKFIKALLSEREGGGVSLDYDHKVTDGESPKDIVPHIIKTLDFAARYLKAKVRTEHEKQEFHTKHANF